ncbi:MAG: hypothetical protein RL885_13335 [Planctomycetota bacterium]
MTKPINLLAAILFAIVLLGLAWLLIADGRGDGVASQQSVVDHDIQRNRAEVTPKPVLSDRDDSADPREPRHEAPKVEVETESTEDHEPESASDEAEHHIHRTFQSPEFYIGHDFFNPAQLTLDVDAVKGLQKLIDQFQGRLEANRSESSNIVRQLLERKESIGDYIVLNPGEEFGRHPDIPTAVSSVKRTADGRRIGMYIFEDESELLEASQEQKEQIKIEGSQAIKIFIERNGR